MMYMYTQGPCESGVMFPPLKTAAAESSCIHQTLSYPLINRLQLIQLMIGLQADTHRTNSMFLAGIQFDQSTLPEMHKIS